MLNRRLVIGVSAGQARCDGRPSRRRRRHGQRQIDVRMQVRVAQPGAIQEQRMIEQRAVAIRRRAQLLEEPGKQLRLIDVQLRVLGQLFWLCRRGATARGAPR